jgi:two-component system OmpR family sensor kinase
MRAWRRLGLRGRLALSIGALFLVAFGVVFVAVRAEMANESRVIDREEGHESSEDGGGGDDVVRPSISPISDAQEEMEETFLLVGAGALVVALAGAYAIASRTASPLRRMAASAGEVSAGDLAPRLREEPRAAPEVRGLVAGFNQMLDRLDLTFSRQRRFVADASHELRTPLTAVRGQIEVLARDPEPSAAEVWRVEAAVLAELARVERLVEELLALARLDEGAGPERREIDLAELLRELAAAQPGGVELGELAAGRIDADPELLARVVRNLLANARRHTGESGRVALGAVGAGNRAIVAVDDDGPGVPAAEREQVFERFHRVGSARDRSSGGSGLGLAISRAIVEAHGGRIWIEDSPLGGARAAFELPGFRPQGR